MKRPEKTPEYKWGLTINFKGEQLKIPLNLIGLVRSLLFTSREYERLSAEESKRNTHKSIAHTLNLIFSTIPSFLVVAIGSLITFHPKKIDVYSIGVAFIVLGIILLIGSFISLSYFLKD